MASNDMPDHIVESLCGIASQELKDPEIPLDDGMPGIPVSDLPTDQLRIIVAVLRRYVERFAAGLDSAKRSLLHDVSVQSVGQVRYYQNCQSAMRQILSDIDRALAARMKNG